MSLPSACPSLEDLERFLQGDVHVADAERFHEHFDRCPRCAHVLQALENERAPREPAAEALAVATRIGTVPENASSPHSPRPTPLSPSLAGELGASTVVRSPANPAPGAVQVEVFAPPDARPADSTQAVIAMLAPPQEGDEIGRLGPYRILKVLGSGATGVVFQAQDVQLRRTVALKTMKPSPEGGEVARQRFLREARAAAALEHDHVVTIYQVGEDRGMPYLAMQLLQGETLDSLLRRESRLPTLEILRISREIAEGLAAAHDQGVIHRDIKPANIWLEKRPGGGADAGRVKLVDFGLARAASDDEQLTKTGTILGTPAYMAPEQARAAEIDHRADLFSLGCVIYRMATGQLPFQADDTMGMLLAVASDDPKPMRTFNPEVPDALVGLVNRLLAKNAVGRPASAREVVGALRDIEDVARERSTVRSVNRRPTPADQPGPKKAGRGLALALILVATVGMAAATWFRVELLRWVNNRGVVEINSKESTIQLTIKSKDGAPPLVTSSRQIELDAGEYEIEGVAGSRKLVCQPNKLTIARGDHKPVTAFVEKAGAHGSKR